MTESSAQTRFSFANGANSAFIEELFEKYKQDPQSVDASWQKFFEGYEFAAQGAGSGDSISAEEARNNSKVEALINAYRRLGHLQAHLNPLAPKPGIAESMMPEAHGLRNVNPNIKFHPANLPTPGSLTLTEVMDLLTSTYCGTIGADYREINDIEATTWFQNEMEACRNKPTFAPEIKKRMLQRLGMSEGFERFLQARYLGQKRFSLEGAEALIPMIDAIFEDASANGVEEICMGMSHRGRLNVLANVMQKSPEMMLKEFEGSEAKPFDIDGDVKYHMGFANEVKTASGKPMRLYLSPNPSHLEAANPVVEGFARARQRLVANGDASRIIPILMHGDAAFIGQGLVAETLNLSRLESYATGGTIHIIINNQIGFTTGPRESRSCTYSSDIAKMIRAPVLHVNADDPEAVIWTAKLALAYRQKFLRDIVIDLIGYRRHGHNETDEPGYTQPMMYKVIDEHPTVYSLYRDKLIAENVVAEAEVTEQEKSFRAIWQSAFETIKGGKYAGGSIPVPPSLQRSMNYYKATEEEVEQPCKTGLAKSKIQEVGERITTLAPGFTAHPKLSKILEQRKNMLQGLGNIDWAMSELLAFGTLATEGHHVRLSGQDCRRGTFSSRHAVFFDYNTGAAYEILNKIKDGQAQVDVINSPLSEQGVMGFDFGYSVADRDALVLWEAQFGDFANGAQIIIDQFLVASEAKWKQCCGLVLMLPHGYEGQGPEHSNARPERFLQLCGNLNIQVANTTTPAQHFHILRRQVHREFRKPLVLMTPKSLLRHPRVISQWSDFVDGCFTEVIADNFVKDAKSVQSAILCTGKIYYELEDYRAKNEAMQQTPVIRVEQLYPFPDKMLKNVLSQYPNLREIIWAQEEPMNMGAWTFVRPKISEVIGERVPLHYAGRISAGTTAEGSLKAHVKEQQRIIEDAFNLGKKSELSGGKVAAMKKA